MRHSTVETAQERRFDFANILFGGPCNQRCPFCIGTQLPPHLTRDNLDEYPPRNLDTFASLLDRHQVKQLVLSGTSTDPQLYRREGPLVHRLRNRLPGVQISLHTNGQLALAKIDLLNLYDRVTLSWPSFDRQTFQAMTGTRQMPNLEQIVQAARVPVKVSCLLTARNVGQVEDYLGRCQQIGVQRVVFRRLYGDSRTREILASEKPVTFYRANPVYAYRGMQVTYWHFSGTTSSSLNLFPDGSISSEYLIVPQSSGISSSKVDTRNRSCRAGNGRKAKRPRTRQSQAGSHKPGMAGGRPADDL